MFEYALHAIAAALPTNKDNWSGGGWSVERVRTGMNNALYRVEIDGDVLACKLCVSDERNRAQREYEALTELQSAGVDLAPEPLGLDLSCTIVPYPAVVYRWLFGATLGPTFDDAQIGALLDALHRLHTVRPGERSRLPEAWFHWFDREPYLQELTGFLGHYGEWLRTQVWQGELLYRRLEAIVAACARAVGAMRVEIAREAVALRLCHVDPNPTNAVWGIDRQLRWIDWEYSGWGDIALDLAEYRWHAGLAQISDRQQTWLRANYIPPSNDERFWERVALWDQMLAARWPFLALRWLWSVYNGPDRLRLTMQELKATELRDRLSLLIARAEALAD